MSGFGLLMLIIGAALAVFGVFGLNDAPDIVGGDAYNYIIGAVRGVGWIAAGGVSSLFGIGLLLLERNYAAQDARTREGQSHATSAETANPFAIAEQ